MVFEVTLGNAITVLALLVMGAWAMAKVIARIYERRSVERFESAEEQLAYLQTGMEQVSKRLAAVEITLKDAPKHDDLAKIYERVNRLTEEVKGLVGEFAGAKHTLGLLHQFLLNGGGQR